ncbi:MAG: response regulator [Chloroflexi bacterium]|nr:MAG: response regulator [Chloroflexota bacterium]
MEPAEPDVRQLFADDAVARLDRMGEQLLELEHAPGQADLLANLFREAHSLKGGAGVIGLQHVADVAHALENPLQRLRAGDLHATATLTDAMLATIDGLRSLITHGDDTPDDDRQKAIAEALVSELAAGVARDNGAGTNGNGRHAAGPPAGDAAAAQGAAHAQVAATMQVAIQRLDQIDRLVGESASAYLRVGQLLAETLGTDPATIAEYREVTRLLSRLQDVTTRVRMVPISTVTPSLHRAVRDVARAGGKQVRWVVGGGETEIDRNVLEKLHDPLVHLVRNSVDHGIEAPEQRLAAGKPAQGTVRLHAAQRGSEIVISVSDDGGGIDLERVRAAGARAGLDTAAMSDAEVTDLIFRQGMSTAKQVTEISGRGVGLDVVRTNLGLVRGRVEVHSTFGQGTEFVASVPITLTIVQCLVVEASGQRLAVPLHSVLNLLPPDTDVSRAEGQAMVMHGSVAVPVVDLSPTLAMGDANHGQVVVLADALGEQALRVDALVGRRDLVVKGLGRLLPRLTAVAGAGIEPDGSVVVVVDVPGLVARARLRKTGATPDEGPPPHRPSVLIVDDALTVRELERSILERAGYAVRVAANGREALELLRREPADLVLTDVEMPLLDGLGLTETIRKSRTLARTPVVILTSHDSEADRERGLAAGANAYIVKSGFDQQRLLSMVEQLLLAGSSS